MTLNRDVDVGEGEEGEYMTKEISFLLSFLYSSEGKVTDIVDKLIEVLSLLCKESS
jgi:hypothetical protein